MNCELFAPRLEDNVILVCLVLAYVILNVFGWTQNGVMRLQVQYMHETRNARSFTDIGMSAFNPMRPILLLQLFIFSGLCLFCSLSGYTAYDLLHPDLDTCISLVAYICFPVVWFYFQWASFNWANYLFGDNERIQILNRLYRAIHLLASPLALLLFILLMNGNISPLSTMILLSTLFIFCQVIFIFHGFKIFFTSLSSLCFIILYLCALEIAPLVIIWHKMSLTVPTF